MKSPVVTTSTAISGTNACSLHYSETTGSALFCVFVAGDTVEVRFIVGTDDTPISLDVAEHFAVFTGFRI